MSPNSGKDDDECQEEGDEDNVEGEGGNVGCDGGTVAVGVEGGTSVLPEGIKPSACHRDDLASRIGQNCD